MTKIRLICICGIALLIFSVVGCQQELEQVAVEQQTVERLISLLRIHSIEYPNAGITNTSVVFTDLRRPYPYGLHRQFKSFKKYAGFKNSFYEKYYFPLPGLTNRLVQGEILLLNAEPFPDRAGKLGRIVVSKVGEGHADYRLKWVSEENVQSLFSEAGVKIPTLQPFSPPPPAPPDAEGHEWNIWAATQGVFHALAYLLGLGVERAGLLQVVTFGCLGTAAALASAWALWRWFKNNRKRTLNN